MNRLLSGILLLSLVLVGCDTSPSGPAPGQPGAPGLVVAGTYVGIGTVSNTGCTDPDINSRFQTTEALVITQTGADFVGISTSAFVFMGQTFTATGRLDGTISGNTISGVVEGALVDTRSRGAFEGTVDGGTITFDHDSDDTVGETCTTVGTSSVSKDPGVVYLLSVSGHCLLLLCDAPRDYRYLDDPGSAVDALKTFFDGRDVPVIDAHYGDRFLDTEYEEGFLTLLERMQTIAPILTMAGSSAKLIIVAHSHGVTWAHMATRALPDVPVSVLISVDGVCLGWTPVHGPPAKDWTNRNPGHSYVTNWEPKELSAPCNAWTVQGSSRHTTDVTFPSVGINLETRSAGTPILNDTEPNLRLDGTRTGICTLPRAETHDRLHEKGSEGMTWVVEKLDELWSSPSASICP